MQRDVDRYDFYPAVESCHIGIDHTDKIKNYAAGRDFSSIEWLSNEKIISQMVF